MNFPKPQRKIFNYDNLNEFTISDNLNIYKNNITACGCLFYKIKNSGLELLLIKYKSKDWPKLDDFGGKIDLEDESVESAMKREVSEETNGIIVLDKDLHCYSRKYFYNQKSKYYCCLIEVDEDFCNDTSIFGDLEITDNIERNVDWYNFSNIQYDLALRIFLCDDIMAFLIKLNKEIECHSQLPKWLVHDAKTTIDKYKFDSSHDMEHFVNTWFYATIILKDEFSEIKVIENMSVKDGIEVVLFSAFIHDRVDSKYMNVDEELEIFKNTALGNNYPQEKLNAIIYIISHMSYSKRIERLRNGLSLLENNIYKTAMGIVIDADQLEAYRIERVIAYQSNFYKDKEEPERSRLIDGWCKTIFVKRVLAYKDNFMNTRMGKEMCEDKHLLVEKYVEENLNGVEMFEY
jgi:HD superfamily phosphodiesterase